VAENQSKTLATIKCAESVCGTTDFASNWESEPDYILDMTNRYFISVSPSSSEESQHYAPLDFADIHFMRQFREPTSYHSPDREVWRLLSREAQFKGRNVQILVGHAEQSVSNMLNTTQSALRAVDNKLKKVAEKIAET
jgi:hypothetical protein